MTDLLMLLSDHALRRPGQPALICGTEQISYKELDDYSSRLALYLDGKCRHSKNPIVIYGHKNPFMPVCFFACAKAGLPFCPVDTAILPAQLQMILDSVNPSLVFAAEKLPTSCKCRACLSLEEIRLVLKETRISSEDVRILSASLRSTQYEDIFYILFTVGKNGVPRGTEITAQCLHRSLEWFCREKDFSAGTETIVINQAPFSFALSVLDFYAALACGQTLWCLDRHTQKNPSALIRSLLDSHASVFVATPSFAEFCLDLPDFCEKTLPELHYFYFCGELLESKTVQKLYIRFPAACVYNTYGHTETTAAVTQIQITSEIAEKSGPLPSGMPKPDTLIEIWDNNGTPVEEGVKGEIVILGDTIGRGYFKNPFLTKESFFTCVREGKEFRGYRTGDMGYLQQGILFFCGRMDLKVKVQGYEIELEDIERNLLRLPQISRAAVLPNIRNHKVRNLCAWVVCPEKHISDKTYTSQLKEDLLSFLPEYLIPKKFIFVKQLPVTGNGRLDRQALKNMVS